MSAMRLFTTGRWWRTCEPRARSSSRSSTKSPMTALRWCFRRMAWPNRCRKRAARRNLFHLDATCPLGLQGSRPGRAAAPGGPRNPADRPCRPPRGDRHDGPAAGGRGDADRDRRRRGGVSCRAIRIKLAYVTQTTLVGRRHARHRRGILQRRFPAIAGPRKNDICYATSNRQEAVKAIAPTRRRGAGGRRAEQLQFDAPRRGGAKRRAAPMRMLVQTARDIPWERLANLHSLGLTAGASAPEHLVRGDHRRIPRGL